MALIERLVVLSRPECSLCEAMLVELCEFVGAERAAEIEVRDITGDEQLERKYGQRIPVLLIGDEFVCAYRLDRERVGAFLADSD